MTTHFQPKGGMCGGCTRAHKDCSYLPFQYMPRLAQYTEGEDTRVIVRCTEFKNKPEPRLSTLGMLLTG
jgi:hypothetical protein